MSIDSALVLQKPSPARRRTKIPFAGKTAPPPPMSTILPPMRNPVGKPPRYKTEEALFAKCEEYFCLCDEKKRFYTVVALALYLGFTGRMALFAMLKRRKYVATIRQMLSKIEAQRSEMLINPDNRNSRGSIFDLQNNFGWRDRQDINVSGTVDTRMAVIPVFSSLDDWQKAWDRQLKQAPKIPEIAADSESK